MNRVVLFLPAPADLLSAEPPLLHGLVELPGIASLTPRGFTVERVCVKPGERQTDPGAYAEMWEYAGDYRLRFKSTKQREDGHELLYGQELVPAYRLTGISLV